MLSMLRASWRVLRVLILRMLQTALEQRMTTFVLLDNCDVVRPYLEVMRGCCGLAVFAHWKEL